MYSGLKHEMQSCFKVKGLFLSKQHMTFSSSTLTTAAVWAISDRSFTAQSELAEGTDSVKMDVFGGLMYSGEVTHGGAVICDGS